MLQKKNPLPIDSDVTFCSKRHAYCLKSVPDKTFTSVTSIAARRFPAFDAVAVSRRLATSSLGNKYAGKSAPQIRDMWKQLAHLGTTLHADIEKFYNNEGPVPDHLGFQRTSAIFDTVLNLQPWRTELRMASKTTGIAGTADMIFTHKGCSPRNGVTIVDWKRTETIEKASKYDSCKLELAHLPASKFWKYALQLNLYAQLLWDTCEVPTIRMLLVLLHPDRQQYDILRVPRMPEASSIYFSAK